MSDLSAAAFEVAALSPGTLLRRRAFAHAGLMIGVLLLALIVLIALLAPLMAPYDPYAQDLSAGASSRHSGSTRAAWSMCSGPTISVGTISRA